MEGGCRREFGGGDFGWKSGRSRRHVRRRLVAGEKSRRQSREVVLAALQSPERGAPTGGGSVGIGGGWRRRRKSMADSDEKGWNSGWSDTQPLEKGLHQRTVGPMCRIRVFP